jgi:hypothetical protein
MKKTVAQALASAVQARANCIKSGNKEWQSRWTDQIVSIALNQLPSGSGIDAGTTVDIDASDATKLVLLVAYHHMSEHGFYDGWTEHRVIVTPDWRGLTLRISGPNRNEIKDYLHDCLANALEAECIEGNAGPACD